MVLKYDALKRYLISKTNAGERNVSMTFSEIERVLGDSLPGSEREHRSWWGNDKTHVQARAWMGAGWKIGHVDINSEQVTFKR